LIFTQIECNCNKRVELSVRSGASSDIVTTVVTEATAHLRSEVELNTVGNSFREFVDKSKVSVKDIKQKVSTRL
jgi:hypothetical protein